MPLHAARSQKTPKYLKSRIKMSSLCIGVLPATAYAIETKNSDCTRMHQHENIGVHGFIKTLPKRDRYNKE